MSGYQGLRRGVGVATRGNGRGDILGPDSTSVNTLAVTLCYNFARYYHWGNWVRDTKGLYYSV